MSAIQVAEAITEHNGGRPMNRLLLAEAMGYSPSSSGFRDRIAASAKYGLTEGNYNSESVSLTPLGTTATRPRNEHERTEARRQAMRSITVFDALLDHFANSRLPQPEFLKNTLELDPYGVDPAWSIAVADAFAEDAIYVGYLREIGGSPHIVLDGSATTPIAPPAGTPVETDEAEQVQPEQTSDRLDGDPAQPDPSADRPLPVQLFIAHGKNRIPLEQLKRILDDWKVPYLVAVDEPNAGRPISEKVADTMRACSAGIFVFTADEQFTDSTGASVGRPSGNVVYELGAASLLYGRKIVILKEEGVSFPSDFSDLGWIEFKKDDLRATAMDLLREMIALDAIRLVSAGTA